MRTKLTPTRVRCMKPGTRERIVWDSEMPHLGVRVRPNGTKRFVYRITIKGKTLKKSLGHVDAISVDEARSAASRLEGDLLKAVSGARHPRSPSGDIPTFAVFVEETYRPHSHPRKKMSTIKWEESNLAGQLLPTFGGMPMDRISKSDVLEWYVSYSQRAPGGANSAMMVMSAILNYAVRLEVIPKNPARKIRRNPGRKMTRFLSDVERARLLAALDCVTPRRADHADALRLLLFTGCRMGEIVNLRWDEVREDRIDLTDSKTGPRPVWIGMEAKEVLDRRRTSLEATFQAAPPSDHFVFPHRSKLGQPLSGLWKFWWRFRKGIGLEDVRLHDLRHSYATEAVRRGVPLPVVSKLLGHSTIAMTMRYAHVSDTVAEETAEKVGLHINALLDGETSGT